MYRMPLRLTVVAFYFCKILASSLVLFAAAEEPEQFQCPQFFSISDNAGEVFRVELQMKRIDSQTKQWFVLVRYTNQVGYESFVLEASQLQTLCQSPLQPLSVSFQSDDRTEKLLTDYFISGMSQNRGGNAVPIEVEMMGGAPLEDRDWEEIANNFSSGNSSAHPPERRTIEEAAAIVDAVFPAFFSNNPKSF